MKDVHMELDSLTVIIEDRLQMETALNTAVHRLTAQAEAQRQGILVTRTAPHSFSVCLSPYVPYGTIQEVTTW